MRLWIGLSLPQLPLEVFCPNWCNDTAGAGGGVGESVPSVVLEQERVMALSPLARASGLQPGLRRGGVLMLAPDARLYERSPEREAEAVNAVAMDDGIDLAGHRDSSRLTGPVRAKHFER